LALSLGILQTHATLANQYFPCSGAQVVFHSLISPLFARFFQQDASASLRNKAENLAKSQ
jgi:hypothetical protein